MTFLPVVGRELRVASRRRNTYWTRFFGALTALAICTWIWLTVGDGPRSELPKNLFYTISGLAFAYSLISGIGVTADSLSEEKREGTLGLLFLTDLKGYDVVLGKLVATSVNCFYRLLAVFPILAIPLLFGGLTYAEFWRMVLVLTNTLFLSLAAGIFISSLSLHERKARAGTFLLILLVAGGLPLVGTILAYKVMPFRYDLTYLLSSPGYSYSLVFDRQYSAQSSHFWISSIIAHLIGWTCLVLASVIARYSWQDKPAGSRRVVWDERWQRWQFGSAAIRSAFRTRLLDINPTFWLAGRNRVKPTYVFAFVGLAGATWLWLYWKYPNDMLDPATYIPTAILLHTIIKFWVASEACRPLAEDRRTGALELLLSTPLSVGEILRGQILALKRQFAGAITIILLADFAMLLGGMRDRFLDTPNEWLMLCLAGILMFIADLYTLAYVGMWLGLTVRKANVAARGAIARILVFPTLVFLGFMTSTVFINVGRFNNPGDMLLGSWFVIGMLNNLFFYAWAHTNLRQEFRTVATQRFDTKKPRSRETPKQAKPLPAGQPASA
jgi:ABC-type Na+ efflux pump permease subunit